MYKAFGKVDVGPKDQPIYTRSNSIKELKNWISFFMPSGSTWVDLPDGTGYGNPTQHKSINDLIKLVVKFESYGEGAEFRDVRDMVMAEFKKELEVLCSDDKNTPDCLYRNSLMGIYQWHFITRADDCCNFKVDDPKGNETWDWALLQSVQEC
jgi:hypothetical protein